MSPEPSEWSSAFCESASWSQVGRRLWSQGDEDQRYEVEAATGQGGLSPVHEGAEGVGHQHPRGEGEGDGGQEGSSVLRGGVLGYGDWRWCRLKAHGEAL